MIVTSELVERIFGVCREYEHAILNTYRNRPGNPNQIEFESFGKVRATRVPFIPFFNRAYGFTEDQIDQLPKVIEFYRQTNNRFALELLPEAVTEKLSRELMARGLAPWGYGAKFYAPLDELPGTSLDSRVEPVLVDESSVDEYVETALLGWGMPAEHKKDATGNIRLRLGVPGVRLFLGRIEGRPVGSAVFFRSGDVGYLADASTAPAHRGLGCQIKLMEARIRFAREQGCKLIIGGAHFGNPSFRNMQRIGLKVAYTAMAWHYIA